MSRACADITGQQFGRLLALYPSGERDRKGSVIWHCRCDCGTELDISYNRLKYTELKSCGCRKREYHQELSTNLTHVAGTSVDILKSKKLPSDNTTGHKGVYYIRGKYVAKIVFQNKQYYLGTFEAAEQAAEARQQAEEQLFDRVTQHYERWKQRAQADPGWAAGHPVRVTVNQEKHGLEVVLEPDFGGVSQKSL